MTTRITRVRGFASALIAALLTFVGLAVTPVQPAQAATGWDRCPTGRLCLFTGLDGTGSIGIYSSGDSNLGVAPGPLIDDNVESYWNRTSTTWGLFGKAGYGGYCSFMDKPGSGWARRNLPVDRRNWGSSVTTVIMAFC